MVSFFGIGDAFSEGVNSSAFVRDDDSIFIIDVGENSFSTISRYIKDSNIKKVNIALTHLHSDHVGGLSTLIYWLHFIMNIKPVIYAPSGIYNDVKTILDIADNEEDQYRLVDMTVSEGLLYCIKDMSLAVGCVETEHKDNMRCYGYIIKDTAKMVYYSGDSYSLPKSILESVDDFNMIYQDVCPYDFNGNPHMDVDKFKKIYNEKYWNKIVVYHYSDKNLIDKRFKEIGVSGVSFADIYLP